MQSNYYLLEWTLIEHWQVNSIKRAKLDLSSTSDLCCVEIEYSVYSAAVGKFEFTKSNNAWRQEFRFYLCQSIKSQFNFEPNREGKRRILIIEQFILIRANTGSIANCGLNLSTIRWKCGSIWEAELEAHTIRCRLAASLAGLVWLS